jgi:amine acid ABC transporter, permease protein, 3-TM region, His/Glu/Gln/Arg/opine family
LASALVAITVQFAATILRNPNIDFSVIGRYLFAPEVIDGLRNTLVLTAAAMLVAMVLGVAIAALRTSHNAVYRSLSRIYVWIFRSVPALLMLVIWFNLALVFENLTLGIPGTSLVIGEWQTNDVLTPFIASLLALGLAESAFYSEIVRGGLLGVDSGQREAAKALGMNPFQTFRLVIFPQALRMIVPPTGNEIIGMLKYTSLASIIGFTDLMGTAQQIYSTNLLTIELLLTVCVWYIVCTSVLGLGQYFVERRYGRGYGSSDPRPYWRVLAPAFRFRSNTR